MEYHKAASIFPLDEEHLDALAEDIRRNGLLCPIELLNGKIIDGRRRLLACKQAGVEPGFCDVNVPDPYQYVWSLNYHRRHLTISQRAMCAARYDSRPEKEAAKKRMLAGKSSDGIAGGRGRKNPKVARPRGFRQSRDDIGKLFGVSGILVDRAKRIITKGIPEVAEAVDRDKLTVNRADKLVRLPEKEQSKELEKATAKKPTRKKVSNAQSIKDRGVSKGQPVKGEEEEFDGKLRGKGIVQANEAINCLMRIPKNDPFRERGFQIVMDWIRHNR